MTSEYPGAKEMNENPIVVINIVPEDDGFGAIEQIHDIASQGKTKKEALLNVLEAISLYFEDEDVIV